MNVSIPHSFTMTLKEMNRSIIYSTTNSVISALLMYNLLTIISTTYLSCFFSKSEWSGFNSPKHTNSKLILTD
ncbi:unknown [Vaccinia virus Tian Tan]|uniref:Uncharacterized protein n=1 Tax=Vaccinia virus (strain Tian Tan) TaxID=10253 RepID=Q9JFB3_VACCT|nr:unknown [Vaccinia virus Tian Tan]